jgi:5'-methylthioadenosine phosphorylase
VTVGVFGGSGFTSFLDVVDEIDVDTPYGAPSAPITVHDVGGRRAAFLPRHGRRHEHAPHGVNYRANLWALREVGCTSVLAPFAAGSLSPAVHPGDLVVVDQLVDRTWGRADTFHDRFDDGPQHISLADPYDAGLRAELVAGAARVGLRTHDGGTVVVIQGPRFATRAESSWYRAQGWTVINMTQYPEAALARELDLPYAGVALITDYDTGVEGDEEVAPVSQEEVFAFFEQNVDRLRGLLVDVIPRLP